MRTAAAYTSKLRAQALGRNFKVQDTNHRAFTSTLYRGAAGCGPVNYTQLNYVEACKCVYIGPARKTISPFPCNCPCGLDGGTASASGDIIYDAGNQSFEGTTILDGGVEPPFPCNCPCGLDGGTASASGDIVYDAGNQSFEGTTILDGGVNLPQ